MEIKGLILSKESDFTESKFSYPNLNMGYTKKQTAQMLQTSIEFVREACRQSSLPMDEA